MSDKHVPAVPGRHAGDDPEDVPLLRWPTFDAEQPATPDLLQPNDGEAAASS
jgi:hypothetical protein